MLFSYSTGKPRCSPKLPGGLGLCGANGAIAGGGAATDRFTFSAALTASTVNATRKPTSSCWPVGATAWRNEERQWVAL